MNVNPLTRFPANPDGHRLAIEFVEEAQRLGHRIHPMFMINVKGIHFALDSTFVLDEMPTFRATSDRCRQQSAPRSSPIRRYARS